MDETKENSFLQRTSLTDGKRENNANFLSPDIIPLDVTILTPEEIDGILVKQTGKFLARPLRSHVFNNVYLRGLAVGDNNIRVTAFVNELIAWPDLIADGVPIGSVTMSSDTKQEVGGGPVQFNPTSMGGRHWSLVVTQGSLDVPKLTSWNDYVNTVLNSPNYTFLQANWADNTQNFSSSTHFQMRDSVNSLVTVVLTLETNNLPLGSAVSLSCDTFNSNGDPLQITSTEITQAKQDFSVQAVISHDFDATLTVNVNLKKETAPNAATVTLKLFLISNPGSNQWDTLVQLGSDTIIFDDLIRLSHFYTYKREDIMRLNPSYLLSDSAPYNDLFFRIQTTDTANTVRTGVPSHSPEIQPCEDKVLSPKQVGEKYLGDGFLKDVADAKGEGDILSNQPNYIYVRGLSTNTPKSPKVNLYYVPSAILSLPSQWKNNTLTNGEKVVDNPITFESGATQGVTKKPFVWLNPPPPTNGHYCLIARGITDDHPNPFPTEYSIGDFTAWVLLNNAIAWRNVSYQTGSADFSETTQLTLPANLPVTEVYITLQCTNCNGIKVKVSAAVPTDPPIQIDWSEIIGDNPHGVSVGPVTLPVGYSSTLTYSVNLNGKSLPSTANISFRIHHVSSPGTPLWRLGSQIKDSGSPAWDTIITIGSVDTNINR
jgi:hypothetical protein